MIKKLICILILAWTLNAFAIDESGFTPIENIDEMGFTPIESVDEAGFVTVDSGCAGTYGTTSCVSGIDASENRAYLTQITIDCADTAGDVCARLLDADDATHEVLFAIYDDDAADDTPPGTAGEPWTRLWVSPSNVYDAGSASTYYDVCDAFTGLGLETGNYWVGFIAENTETFYERVTSGGTGRYKDIGSFTLPAEWDHAGDSTSSFDRAIYLSF